MNMIIEKLNELESRKRRVENDVRIPFPNMTQEQKDVMAHNNEMMYHLSHCIHERIRGIVEAAEMLGVYVERNSDGNWRIVA